MLNEDLVKHIKNRTKAERKMISLESLLNAYDMGMYFMLCGDRIADAEYIDGEHVQLNFINPPDLLFDSIGLVRCFDILSGYIDEDELIKLCRIERSRDEITECINKQLDMLRTSDIKCLFNLSFRISKTWEEAEQKGLSEKITKEQLDAVCQMSRLELMSRNPFNKVRIFIIEKVTDVYVSIKYHNIFSLLRKCTRDISEESS